MTYKQALIVLMESARRDVEGQGRGIRSTTEDWRAKVKEAIVIVWERVNKRKITESEKFNMNLY